MKKTFCLSLMVIALTGFYACSGPGKNTSANSSSLNTNLTKQPIDTADARLAKDLSIFCTSQIKAGQLAATKASTQKVKEFGKQTAELYTRLSNSLNNLSQSYNIKLPADPTPLSTEKLQKLAATKGTSFDHDYLLQMLKDHNITIREFNAAKNIQCIPLKMFVGSNQGDIIKSAYATSALKDKLPY